MFGSDILEVVIGLVFVYFIMSLLCSAVTEWIARVIAMRAKTLKEGIKNLLNGNEDLKEKIFSHPLVKGISPKKGPGPSAMPARTFSLVLFDTLMEAGKESGTGYADISSGKVEGEDSDVKGRSKSLLKTSQQFFKSLGKNIDLLQADDETKQVLRALLTSAKTRVDSWEDAVAEFRTSIEKWFDDSMERVSGWYKRKSQLIILGLAVLICAALNVDTFGIANSLFHDAALRTSVAAAAEAQVQQPISTENISVVKFNELSDELTGLNLPIGWTRDTGVPNRVPDNPWGWLFKLLGIIITALAASLGAPFWFDLLGKLVNMRASGKKPEETNETPTAVAGAG